MHDTPHDTYVYASPLIIIIMVFVFAAGIMACSDEMRTQHDTMQANCHNTDAGLSHAYSELALLSWGDKLPHMIPDFQVLCECPLHAIQGVLSFCTLFISI